MTNWFTADKAGLAKLVEDRPKIFIIHELLANVYDTGCNSIDITLRPVAGKPLVDILVQDDHPEGFADLSHAWTLFAESERKADPTTIGRYNMGEKLVLALCERAVIRSTKGSVTFDKSGRHTSRRHTKGGSVFEATVRMTRQEYDQVLNDLGKILWRPDVDVRITTEHSAQYQQAREPLAVFEATLPTVLGDDGGSLRRTRRKTTVQVYEVLPGEGASVYELGIPVVPTGDTYHVNVLQKVPLNMDRNNVPPAFLRELRGHVLNAMAARLTKQAATETWVTEALGSKTVEHEAVRTAVTKRFGEKVAIYDPSDREANGTLITQGYNVIRGGSLPREAWANVKDAGAAKPSGQLQPTPKPYSSDPNADPANIMPREKWTPAMEQVAEFAIDLHRELYGADLTVRFVTNVSRFQAAYEGDVYGPGVLDFFTQQLSKKWFEEVDHAKLVSLIGHEFAHRGGYDHNEERYHEAFEELVGKVSEITFRIPEFFEFLHNGDRRG